MKLVYNTLRTVCMSKFKTRKKDEIEFEIFSNKNRIKQLVEKLQVLKEITGEKQ